MTKKNKMSCQLEINSEAWFRRRCQEAKKCLLETIPSIRKEQASKACATQINDTAGLFCLSAQVDKNFITPSRAKELLAGDLGCVYRNILRRCCVPIYWSKKEERRLDLLHSGTLTLVKTPQKLIGITAAHVIRQLETDKQCDDVVVQFFNAVIQDISSLIIDISDKYDLATISLEQKTLESIGKDIMPLEMWPPKPPEEGKGILIAGYPGIERLLTGEREVDFGLFTALVVSRIVNDTQISWLLQPEYQVPGTPISPPPPEYNLGGVSGGPMIGIFETKGGIIHYCLSGIITECPDFENSDIAIERLIATRADLIYEDGKISR